MTRRSALAALAAATMVLVSGPARSEPQMAALERALLTAQAAQVESQKQIAELQARLRTLETRPASPDAGARFEEISSRLLELESSRDEASRSLPDWLRRTRLSGSADVGYFGGQEKSLLYNGGFKVWDMRVFLDSNLGEDVMLGEHKIFRDVGMHFEWNVVRLGEVDNDVGEMYADLQGFLDTGWVNFQVGRFQIPFGEAYLRYSTGYADDPFISKTLGGPWFWDEGVKMYGGDAAGRFGYVASVSDGETPFNDDDNENKQLTLKVFSDPFPWIHVSASLLRSGRVGTPEDPARAAIWFGESFPINFGAWTGVPNYDHGAPIADGPRELENVGALEMDAILRWKDLARLWLSWGTVDVNSTGPDVYDRNLRYWIAELMLEGKLASSKLAPLYLALRANGYGTYDGNEGYLLEPRYSGELGWNMESIEAYSLALGWRLTERAVLRAEVTRQDIDLVRGATSGMSRAAGGSNFFALAMGLRF